MPRDGIVSVFRLTSISTSFPTFVVTMILMVCWVIVGRCDSDWAAHNIFLMVFGNLA